MIVPPLSCGRSLAIPVFLSANLAAVRGLFDARLFRYQEIPNLRVSKFLRSCRLPKITLRLFRGSPLRRPPPFDQGYLTAMFGRALRAPSHSLDFDFYASILRSSFPGLVVRDRFAFTEPLSGNSTAVDGLLYDVVFNRIDPPIGQCP